MTRQEFQSEGSLCDGYDVTCMADGQHFTFHFLVKPADSLAAVTALVAARLAAEEPAFDLIAEDGSYA